MPKVTSGKIEHFDNLKSNFVDPRNIDVWLPDGYSEEENMLIYTRRQSGSSCFF
jgi:hypothetical protein